MKVFVVDDEREMVDLVQLGLKKRGFQVVTFGSGTDALTALTEHDVDVVVTDLNMKGMTGLELCQRIVADRPDLPVIMLTAFGSFETAVGAIRAGAYDFVTKPVEWRRFWTTLGRFLPKAAEPAPVSTATVTPVAMLAAVARARRERRGRRSRS